jgi:hypothetical protein
VGDEDYVEHKRPNRVYFSREIATSSAPPSRAGRYVSRVLVDRERPCFADVEGQVVLRQTRTGRQQIKAFFLVDDRRIRTLTLQRFTTATNQPHEVAHFSLCDEEIQKLLDLAVLIRTAEFDGHDKVRLDEGDLAQFTLSPGAVRALLKANPRVLAEIVERDVTERDIVTIAYRRSALERFNRLLQDEAFFQSEKTRTGRGRDEDVWQHFFESNPWIFGYGLFYVFTAGYDEARLEQTVTGALLGEAGKRTDALLRTRGIVSSLCFVEIKTHRTPLLDNRAYRSDTWAPSEELSGAVAQIQKTVDSAERALQRRLLGRDADGNPTGDATFLLRPRSVVVAGTLGEFQTPKGTNEPRFTGFELYRRQLVAPDIITFDELYERARFIVESTAQQLDPASEGRP